MTSALKRKDYLSLLANAKDRKRRKALLEIATKNEIDSLSEIIWNLVNGKVRVSPSKLKQLRKVKKHLHHLTNKRLSYKKRKNILMKTPQQGGFLTALLPVALSVLGSLFGGK